MKGRLIVIAAVLAGVALWAALAARVGPLLLPSPLAVVIAGWADRARIGTATLETASAALAGLCSASILALGAAVLTWRSAVFQQALLPYTVLLQIIPIVAIAPLLVVWLGYGEGVAMVTAGIACFYPVYSAASTGLVAPGPDLVDLLRLYGAGRWSELLILRLPAALPALFSGLRTAAGLAVIGAIVGEFVGSNGTPPTLGWMVVYCARAADTARGFAAIAAAGVLALTMNVLLRLAERRFIGRWYGVAR